MLNSDFFQLAFFSSSSFTLSILKNIFKASRNGLNLLQLLESKKEIFHPELDLDQIKSWNLLELQKPIQLSVVVSQPDRQNRKKIIANPIATFARENGINLFTPIKFNREFLQSQLQFNLAVVASFGQIISQKALDSVEFGFINWHPSDLPKYRGSTPLQTIIFAGEKLSKLSWIEMTKEMDAGDILLKIPFEIEAKSKFLEVANLAGELGKNSWIEAVILQILNKKNLLTSAQKQDSEAATFTSQLTKEYALIDIKINSAQVIFNHFRAFQLFPTTAFKSDYFQENVKIIEVTLPQDFKNYQPELQFLLKTKPGAEFLQLKINKQIQTFLVCAKSTFLPISKVGLSNGKVVDLKGLKV